VLLEDIYLETELFMGIDRIDLANKSLAQVVSDHYYLIPENGRQLFTVEPLDSERSEWLQLSPSEPILTVRRTLNFPQAPNAVFSVLFCRTDVFAFSQTIQSERSCLK
jgi:GntR family transcriptional regulator